MSYKNRRRIVLYALILVILGFLSFTFYDLFLRKWDAEKALPSSAKNVHVKIYESFNPIVVDFIYTLKAKITEKEFQVYRQKMGFVEAPEEVKKYFRWSLTSSKKWWNPSEDLECTFYDPNFRTKQSNYRIMKYENGYLYFMYKDI